MYKDYVLKALVLYLERGKKLLQLLDEGKYDEAESVFNDRKAGFYNFMALDSLALKFEGYNINCDKKGIELWEEIKLVDSQLKDKIVQIQSELKKELKKVSNFKTNLSKYKSYTRESKELLSEI